LQADPTEGIKTPKPAKTEGFVTWSDADVRHYYNRWPLGARERIMIDVYLFTGFRRGDAASFGPVDMTVHVQERIGPDRQIEKVTVPIITKRLEKGDETVEVSFRCSMSCAAHWRPGQSAQRLTSPRGTASR
jgi:hypothetical protein